MSEKLVAFSTKAQVHSSVKISKYLLTRMQAFVIAGLFPMSLPFAFGVTVMNQLRKAVSLCVNVSMSMFLLV